MSPSPDSNTPDDSQGGYGSPAPEDEMPDAAESAHTSKAAPAEEDPQEATSQEADTSEDPLLEPLDTTHDGEEPPRVSEEDLARSRRVEPPD